MDMCQTPSQIMIFFVKLIHQFYFYFFLLKFLFNLFKCIFLIKMHIHYKYQKAISK